LLFNLPLLLLEAGRGGRRGLLYLGSEALLVGYGPIEKA
jgi:hypothetical protein